MRTLWTTLLFFLTISFSYGQARISEIKGIDPARNDSSYSFPRVVAPNNKMASARINDELLSDFLDIKSGEVKKSIFENVWSTPEFSIPRLSDISYTIIANSKKLLSLSISAEGCGAYCEYFTNYYSFDLRTGARITLDGLLSAAGKRVLLDSINSWKRQQLRTKIKETQEALKSTTVQSNKDDKEYYEEMLTLYHDCVGQAAITSFEYLRFYITRKELFVSLDRCSAHFNRSLDDLGDFEFIFNLKAWAKYLTSYTTKMISE